MHLSHIFTVLLFSITLANSLPPCSSHSYIPHTRDIVYTPFPYIANILGNTSSRTQLHPLYAEHLQPSKCEGSVGGLDCINSDLHAHPNPNPNTRKRKPTLLLLHGSSHTGAIWTFTPAGTTPWTHSALSSGYSLLIPDTISQGRSSLRVDLGVQIGLDAQQVAKYFTNTGAYKLWPQATKLTQWVGSGEPGDPVFDAHYAGYVPIAKGTAAMKMAMRDQVVKLVREVIPAGEEVVVVAHSAGANWAIGIVDELDAMEGAPRVSGLVLLEPSGPPLEEKVITWGEPGPKRIWGLTDYAIRYDPPVVDPMKDIVGKAVRVGVETDANASCWTQGEPVRKLVAFKKTKVLVVTSEAGYHVVYDHCTAGWFKQAGAQTDHYKLGEMGIKGNGHMFFIEKNAEQIWKKVEGWIAKL